MVFVDFKKFLTIGRSTIGTSSNHWRAKVVSTYLCSATNQLFIMTKSCLAETVSKEIGGIFSNRLDSH